ncbi:MAG TPA: flagellin [Fibrobacteria bacterium]|nr:flagellin [Fibrobacteria bacterium]
MRIEKHLNDQLTQKFGQTGKDKAKVLEQLATGKRINRASDDAAGLSIAREFEKQIRAYRNAAENIQAGMSAMSIADGASGSINDMLQRQRELAVQGANGAYGQEQRDALDREFQSLSQEIDRVSKSTEFNGQKLLDGTGALADGTGQIQSGADPGDTMTLSASDLSLSALGTGPSSLQSPAAALQAMGSIDAAMRKVNDNRATQGGLSNRFEYAYSNNQNQQVNLAHGLSTIEDLDYAKGLTDKVRNDILQNSQASAISQFNQLSKTHILALLQ